MIPATQPKSLKARSEGLTFASPAAEDVNGAHPLEARVRGWDSAQQDLRFESYRRNFGAAEPIRRTMELDIVDRSAPGLHSDILHNREAHIDWEDVHREPESFDVHARLAARSNY